MNKKEALIDIDSLGKYKLRQILRDFASELGWSVIEEDFSRPWGGYLKFDESVSGEFLELFFPDIEQDGAMGNRMCPKFLIVDKDARLSWQYHNRRSEEWVVLGGIAGVELSEDDVEGEMELFMPEDRISVATGVRHRLIGVSNLLLVAEVWMSAEGEVSDENDIVRLQDDYSRVKR